MSAAPALKPISMASGCLTSLPTHFASKTSHPFLSVPLRPIKPLHLSWPSSRSTLLQSLSVRKNSPLPPLVAQTSDLGELGEAPVSDWEGEDQSEGEIVAEGEPEADGFVEESHPEPPEEAKLFVGGLPFDMDSAKLAQLFNQAGVVEVAEVIYNRETDQSRGFGFVTMRTVEEAEKAVEMFHRYDAGGRLLTVNKAAPRGSRPERSPQESETSSLRIYVGNLPWQVDDSRLVQLFSSHGKVVDARVVQDRETGRSRGFGFVTMASKAELDDAVAALDGENLDGRALRVNAAEERPRRGFF